MPSRVGAGDVEEASYLRFLDSLYVLAFREALAQNSSVLVLDLNSHRSTGSFHGFDERDSVIHGALGARLAFLSPVTYSRDLEPQ
jgi:hypothetical protein